MHASIVRYLQDLAQLQEVTECLIGYHESHEIDPEAFSRLIFVARSVAAFRPTNLVLFAEKYFMSAASGMLALFCPVYFCFSSFLFLFFISLCHGLNHRQHHHQLLLFFCVLLCYAIGGQL